MDLMYESPDKKDLEKIVINNEVAQNNFVSKENG